MGTKMAVSFVSIFIYVSILSSTQWCSKEKDLKTNPFWTSKLTTNVLKPFDMHISTHAIHPALKMASLKPKQ